MGYFPLCVDLTGKTVFLVGDGPQIRDKAEKLKPFSPHLIYLTDLRREDLCAHPALVVVGDMEYGDAERLSLLCREGNVPVNVVDVPRLCTFFFPSLIARGDLTVSVSTNGKSPAAAAYLRRQIESAVPDRTEEILQWLGENRTALREEGILKAAVAMAFSQNRPLTAQECRQLSKGE